jgi:hypothetical protein
MPVILTTEEAEFKSLGKQFVRPYLKKINSGSATRSPAMSAWIKSLESLGLDILNNEQR